ncbi:hypothetical protein PAPYR_12219 [Paratrimastix pyriformis]|uniref:Uncharacterized protein n=1 Tax=Paratrimastix pyriformis TaxID=342808 RepID=A0ABQ8U6V3_9EUKA|nr:hypothetical protein PAPYR_12219 [Paratrimastix pyriformis]
MCDHFDDLINVATHFDIVLMNLQIDDNFFEKTQIIDICEDQFDRLNSIVDEIRDMNYALEKMHKYIVDYYNELFVIVEEDKIKFNPDNKNDAHDYMLLTFIPFLDRFRILLFIGSF